jgi:hypothetical protein
MKRPRINPSVLRRDELGRKKVGNLVFRTDLVKPTIDKPAYEPTKNKFDSTWAKIQQEAKSL